MINDTVSPSEVAKLLGVSRQTVYNRLTKDLSKFVKQVDGKKRLDYAVLDYLGVKNNVKESVNELDNVVKALTQELNIKNEQIKALTEQNRELTAALQNTTQSLLAAQALHASSVQALPERSHWWQRFKKERG